MPGDRDEIEADRVAAQVMRMPAGTSEIQNSSSASPVPSGGQPLPQSARNFFEPRLGHDFSHVRLHTGASAAESAQSYGARAYTYASNIVFNAGEYQPESQAGKQLLAHELVHVVQQRSAPENPKVRRQTIAPNCHGNEGLLNDAWSRAVTMVNDTIATLDLMMTANSEQGGARALMPNPARCVDISFGTGVGLDGPGFTFLGEIIKRFRKIQEGFSAGRNLRCDPETIPSGDCVYHAAFVVVGNNKDIFICPQMLTSDYNVVTRAITIIHEMAHSMLRVGHSGLAENTIPITFYDYTKPLGIEFDDAKKNAYSFEILANCLHGEPPKPTEVEVKPPIVKAPEDRRWSFSALGGISITPGPDKTALAGLAGIAGRYSLREGSMVIFNPYIGLNVLYAPATDTQPQGFFAGGAEAGLRIQKPVSGPFVDISAGGYGGFEAQLDKPIEATGGFTGAVGLGWRWQRIEVGPEARGLVPFSSDDPKRVLVVGKVTARF